VPGERRHDLPVPLPFVARRRLGCRPFLHTAERLFPFRRRYHIGVQSVRIRAPLYRIERA
jgi:hypothetical protein